MDTSTPRRSAHAAVLRNPSPAQPLPFKLEAGAVWSGLFEQDEQVVEWAKNGMFYVWLTHSQNSRSIDRRVVISDRPVEAALDSAGA